MNHEQHHQSEPPSLDTGRDERLATFLTALAGDEPHGEIELRLIEDKRGGLPVDRRWYSSPAEVVAALPELLAKADARSAAIFFGVLRRRARGVGTAADCLSGAVVWVDIDFKDFNGGEAEARSRLCAFPPAPSFLVRSGHGLHGYWILRESAEPGELSSLSKNLGRALGGDHTHDAARILRLPGTFNRKNPEQPILVEFEVFEPDRRYNPSDLLEAVDLAGSHAPQAQLRALPPPDDGDYEEPVAPSMPERVRALMRRNKRIGRLFNNQGKPELDADGVELDRSSSGYDFSFVLALIKEGVTDQAELETALANRPDGSALAKGPRYWKRTVTNALATFDEAQEDAEADAALDFEVKELCLFNSNPARYVVTVDGGTFVLTSGQLRSPNAFALAFMDAIHRVPAVPTKPEIWHKIVNGWLTNAVVVEQPPDASREPRFVEAIETAIANLPVGDAVEDLDHGKAVKLPDGRVGFKTTAMQRLLRDDWPTLDAEDITRVLRELGYTSASHTIDGTKVRIWSRADERP